MTDSKEQATCVAPNCTEDADGSRGLCKRCWANFRNVKYSKATERARKMFDNKQVKAGNILPGGRGRPSKNVFAS